MAEKIWQFYETHEWTQGALKRLVRTGVPLTVLSFAYDPSEPIAYCMIGAMREVYPDLRIRNGVSLKIQNELGRGMAAWNDEPGRKKAHILALCKRLDV